MERDEVDYDEGMFYEKIFAPISATIEDDEKGEQTLTLTDVNGETMTVTGKSLIYWVLFYLRKHTAFKTTSEIVELDQPEKQQMINSALDTAIKKEKPLKLKCLFDQNGELKSITSPIHRQVSWATVRGIVEKVMDKLFPGQWKREPFGTGRWSYRIPVKSDLVSSYVNVDAGNNLSQGRSGIRIYSRYLVDKPGPGGAPACLNYFQVWQVPLQMFGIKPERIDPVKLVGKEKVQNLNMREIHRRDTVKPEVLEAELEKSISALTTAIEGIQPIIDSSTKERLSKKEMRVLLEAYDKKIGIPKYVKKLIMQNVQERTIWGFSNAISYVRTHGELKETKRSLPRDDRALIHNLEMMSGEIISLTPAIRKFHRKIGAITLERLYPQKAEAVQT